MGAGKTAFLNQYRQQARDEWDLCVIPGGEDLQPDQLYALLFRRFGLSHGGASSIEQLIRRFQMLHAAGRLPVLVFDDAQHLPVATLIAVFRLFERRPGPRALIRVLLLATPEIVRRLQTPQLQAMNLQVIQSLELPLLSEDQSHAFLRSLLASAGVDSGERQGAQRADRLVRDAGGVPGRLVQLVSGYQSDTSEDAEGPEETASRRSVLFADLSGPVRVGGALLLFALVLTLLFQDQINRLFLGGAGDAVDSVVDMAGDDANATVKPLILPKQPGSEGVLSPEVVSDQIPVADQVVTPEPKPDLGPATSANQLQLPAITELPPEIEVKGVNEAENDSKNSENVVKIDHKASTDSPESQADGDQSPLDADSLVTRNLGSTATFDQNKPEKVAKPSTLVPKDIKTPVNEPTRARNQSDSGLVHREAWILQRRPERYTLQLVGVGEELAVKRFLEQHRLQGVVAYVRTRRDGAPWFTVLYGDYPNREAALKGRDALPRALRRSGVWPRTFGSVQALIKE